MERLFYVGMADRRPRPSPVRCSRRPEPRMRECRCGNMRRGFNRFAMSFDLALRHFDWGTLYVTSEWVIRVGALFYVPQRRPPSAARAWLLLIFFLPWLGLLLYLLIGRAY